MRKHTTTRRGLRHHGGRHGLTMGTRLGLAAAVLFGAVVTLGIVDVAPASAANPGSLGGTITSRPSCISPTDTTVMCFAKNTGNTLSYQVRTGGSWSGWQTATNVTMAGQPSCVVRDASNYSCFYRTLS